MRKLARRALAVFKAYFLSDIVRSRGLLYGTINMSLWILLFIAPMSLFMGEGRDPEAIASYGFTAILIFLLYSIATWDFAAELRFLINEGVLEYYLATNSGILPHYLGLSPVSMMWLSTALLANYLLLSILYGPPLLRVHDPLLLLASVAMLLVVLFAYGLLLGATIISTGSSGFVIEILGFILPIATGGLAPLSKLPAQVQAFALLTPFSYPAELVRYSILGWSPVLDVGYALAIGYSYGAVFLALSIAYFKRQLRKVLREGVKVATLW